MGLGERLGLLDTRAQGSSAPEFKGLTQTFSNRAGPAGGAEEQEEEVSCHFLSK